MKIDFSFEEHAYDIYHVKTKTDQGLDVVLSCEGSGEVQYIEVDDEYFCHEDDTAHGIFLKIKGRFFSLADLRWQAVAQFSGMIAEHKQEVEDEKSHEKELTGRWSE